MEDLRIVLRPFVKADDQALIYSTWQLGLWGAVPRPSERPSPAFFGINTRAITKIIDNPGTVVQVACASGNPIFIIGYSVMNKKHLHWVYVKEDYRRHGIGTLLTDGFETIDKPVTKIAKALAEKKELRFAE